MLVRVFWRSWVCFDDLSARSWALCSGVLLSFIHVKMECESEDNGALYDMSAVTLIP